MNRKLIRIILTALLLAAAVIVEKTCRLPVWQLLVIYLVPYLLIGYDIIAEAVEGLTQGDALNEDFLMVVATLGALLIGFLPDAATEFPEAVFVMLFFQVGELFEDYAEGQSHRSISALMDIRPDTANVERGGRVETADPAGVQVGETIVVRPGEKVPMDGRILEGTSSLNTVALTGESIPRDVQAGDEVFSGCVNLSGVLRVCVTKTFGESTASRIIDLVEHASAAKSKSETFIARFARIYTPIVVLAALLLAVVPPLCPGASAQSFSVWLYRALSFLVVSCPCALVISVPLTFFGGIGGASRNGILVKGGNYLETLARVGTVAFDKTGTLTEGEFAVTAIHPEQLDEQQLLHLAAHVERYSTHPIAISLKQAYAHEDDDCRVEQVEEISGHGIRARVNGQTVCVGNDKMLAALGIPVKVCDRCRRLVGTIVHVVVDGTYAGHIVIADKVKPDATQAIADLKRLGVEHTVMLTGDRREVGEHVARTLGLDEYHAGLLPADKVALMQQLIARQQGGRKLAFVGDGINDAPVLALADVGIAMGALGSDAAIEAADVVLMDDRPSKVARAIQIARRTLRIARQNVAFAIGIKALVLILVALGMASMWMAVFADVGVMVLAVLNAMRTLRLN